MFVGHYGVAFGARAVEKRIPLWLFFIAVQWVDILWCVLVFLGIERVSIHPGVNPSGPLVFDYYPYTHSLIAAFGWGAVAFGIYRLFTRMKGSQLAGGILALAVASHWFLDLVVHLPDLDLVDESHKVGLGLWNYPVIEVIVEFVLMFGGLAFYFSKSPELSKKRRIAMVLLCVVMAAVQMAGSFGPPPASVKIMAVSGLVLYLLLAGAAFLIEPRRRPNGK
jgi:hypothetical protein